MSGEPEISRPLRPLATISRPAFALPAKHWIVSAHVSNLTYKLYNAGFGSAAELGAPFNVGDAVRPRLWSVSGSYRW